MKKIAKKTKGLIKGKSTAFLVSAGIHIALIIVAGTFVVFNIVKPPPVKFKPVEQLDRPKMKLRKLQVQVKENARPKDSTERIISKTTLSESDIKLPPMSGAGEGLVGGGSIGGFEMMDDLAEMTLLGGQASVGNDLEGTYYYLIQSRNGTPYPGMSVPEGGAAVGGPAHRKLREFFEKGWDDSVFDPFWRAPKKLYATQLFVPSVVSSMGPDKFGDTRMTLPAALWFVHYKGKIAYPEGGRFRFWGFGDDFLYVRINGETVLDANWDFHREPYLSGWKPSAEEDLKYQIAQVHFRVGDWFEMKPGEPVDMEVLIGEGDGGLFASILCVQQEGVDYPEREIGGPLLPIFKMAPTPQHILDEMSWLIPEGQVDLTGGPIFSVY